MFPTRPPVTAPSTWIEPSPWGVNVTVPWLSVDPSAGQPDRCRVTCVDAAEAVEVRPPTETIIVEKMRSTWVSHAVALRAVLGHPVRIRFLPLYRRSR